MDREDKSGRGRKKIEMKQIVREDARQVCFSKRKEGVFSKASNLNILCGAEVAILITSPGGKIYSFGSPSVESVLGRFMSDEPTQSLLTPHDGNHTSQLMQEFLELHHKVSAAKAKRAMLKNSVQDVDPIWCKNVDDMTLEECIRMKSKLEELKANCQEVLKELPHVNEVSSEIVATSNTKIGADICANQLAISSSGPWMRLLIHNEDESGLLSSQSTDYGENGSEKK